MTHIDSVSKLAALMQSQLVGGLSPEKRAQTRLNQEKITGKPAKTQGSERSGSPSAMSAEVLVSIRSLSGDDPRQPQKAFEYFLQSTLAKNLGWDSPNDPEFTKLVSEVLLRMESDAELREAVLDAGKNLVALAQSKS